ncbi:MAG: hypothetical protein IJ821_08195 [Lachnospiraceae bacterium]|nr:hypothetical protein [Lachnospiraceae bacterium]
MRLRRRISNCINQNEGSTLITVIVAIAFVTILTTIILGTTVVNVRMKGIDRRTRDDFYYAEKALNDIYTGLGQELAVIAGDEYDSAFIKAGIPLDPLVPSSVDYNLAENAEKEFRKNFVTEAHDHVDGVTPAQLEAYITTSGRNTHVDKVGTVEYQKKDGSSAGASDAERVVIPGVQISDTDSSGYRAVITTDIVINIPTVDFLGTNADVSDYGIIANEGLYIEGDANISGNVYAGVHEVPNSMDADYEETTDDNSRKNFVGGINIKDGAATFSGNYIVSKGDINLAGNNPKINVLTPGSTDNLANLWYTSLRTISTSSITPVTPTPVVTPPADPTININANVFALNDMTLNANNSTVTIDGNYYGYNDKGSIAEPFLGAVPGRDDAESSAIIINGSNAYLNMEHITNFVLMGKAYIDFTSDSMTNAASTTKQVVPTAESVALKTNQQLYLVPPDFLDGPNPSTESGTFNISIPDSDLHNWFGYPYLNATKIDQNYEVKLTDSTSVYYDYLVFNEDQTWRPEKDGDGNMLKNSDWTDKYTKIDVSVAPLGTAGSVSSKTKFFYDIMTARKAYEDAYNHDLTAKATMSLPAYITAQEATKVQPSAYRLWERINLSMGYEYFDLEECVIGNGTTDAHYYAKNAVVNYEREPSGIVSTVFNNTEGMLRYAGYPQNLFRRYVWLCTKLDGKEDIPLDSDPTTVGLNMGEWTVTYPDSKHAAPICHFVKVDELGTIDIVSDTTAANSEGLKTAAYGTVVAQTGDLNLGTLPDAALVSGNFKGVAIVDGDITVPSNMNVDGLLMATGTITLKGKNVLTYNKGLIQSRIEKEMNLVKNSTGAKADAYKDYYVISYLSKDNAAGVPELIYDVEPGSKIKRDRIEADYNDFMHYENWQKGEK